MNQGKVKERAWKKLIDLSDEVCKRHHLDVIEHPERTKGKSHWEWDMNRQGLSWKAKLKYTIDQVVKASEDFDDLSGSAPSMVCLLSTIQTTRST